VTRTSARNGNPNLADHADVARRMTEGVVIGHTDIVDTVAFSPDGSMLGFRRPR
jgi:hypothetical protein